jgi:hypothetical protein
LLPNFTSIFCVFFFSSFPKKHNQWKFLLSLKDDNKVFLFLSPSSFDKFYDSIKMSQ